MDILRFLEGLRTPIGDAFFSAVTHFGEETVFILIGIVFFWCINKKEGYYLLSIGFIGTVLNQFLKLVFRIERPWIKDSTFTIVESARAQATGYSFPSGHTQSAVGIFDGIARWSKNTAVRIVLIIISVLVPFSRMYLGVHTPADVGVSSIIALILIFGLYPVFHKAAQNSNAMRILMICVPLLAAAYLLFASLYSFPADIDKINFESGIENGYKLLGCSLGIWISYEIDTRYTEFETKAALTVQFLKVILGLIPIIIIKFLLKAPLVSLTGNVHIADFIRYFLLAAFAGCIWPMTFKRFAKLFERR